MKKVILSSSYTCSVSPEEVTQKLINRYRVNHGNHLAEYWGLPSNIDNHEAMLYWVQRIMCEPSEEPRGLDVIFLRVKKALTDFISYMEQNPNPAPLLDSSFSWVAANQIPMQVIIWHHIRQIKHAGLSRFICAVFSDPEIMPKFYKGKASHSYHHCEEGDLLKHSFEVALCAKNMALVHDLGTLSEECAFVCGLIHDVGKIMMFYNDSGVNSSHEAFNFMVLSDHLGELQEQDRHVFEAISNTISQPSKERANRASYLVENIVRMADQLSAKSSAFQQAFQNKPPYFSFSSAADGRVYKRLNSNSAVLPQFSS